ncbi:MAG: site-specific integrase [Oxalobacteraceae bacterium]|jgi:integrase|nr:site-specific integrase [Oxalobacteraceae bacterium]
MASIRNRNGVWQARITRKGQEPVSKSFATRHDAERWARQIETQIDQGRFVSLKQDERTTLGELIGRYRAEVTPQMKSAETDSIKLLALMRNPLCKLTMIALTPARMAEFRDQRLKQVTSGTVIRELAYFSSVINHARREWGINAENPVRLVRKPPSPPGRSRVVSEAELVRILDALTPSAKCRITPWMKPLVELAVETAMRRGELLSLRWSDIDFSEGVAYLQITKNGEGRHVPLSSRAIAILKALPRSLCGYLFPIKPQTVAAAFMRATDRVGLGEVRFHDLRHTATTVMANKLPNVIELAAVTGHKSLSMLKRYYHPKAADLAKKLG